MPASGGFDIPGLDYDGHFLVIGFVQPNATNIQVCDLNDKYERSPVKAVERMGNKYERSPVKAVEQMGNERSPEKAVERMGNEAGEGS